MSSRKPGVLGSERRAKLLDAAEQLMLEEGYAAVTTRRVGAKAEISPNLVHYYWDTMDDLFIEVFRRRAEERLARLAQRVETHPSLRTVWGVSTYPPAVAFNIEFNALANHRKAVKAVITEYSDRYRAMQLEAISQAIEAAGLSSDDYPPMVLWLAMTGIAQVVALLEAHDIKEGVPDALAFIEKLIDSIDGEPPAP